MDICHFCSGEISGYTKDEYGGVSYKCRICSWVKIDAVAMEDIYQLFDDDLAEMRIYITNENEKSKHIQKNGPIITREVVNKITKNKKLSPIEKIESVLFKLYIKSKYVGEGIGVKIEDYPLYHCYSDGELSSI